MWHVLCYPYCAWQKGTNENTNGLLIEYYPKRMDLSKTNNVELKENLDLLNNRPRKFLNYNTPNELINKYIINCCTWFNKLSIKKIMTTHYFF